MYPFSIIDVSVFCVYLLIGSIFIFWYSVKKILPEDRKLFRTAFFAKTLYSFLYCALMYFYYHGGDSFLYFRYSTYVNDLSPNSIMGTLSFLKNPDIFRIMQGVNSDAYLTSSRTVFMVKLTAFINLFTFRSFLTTSWVYSMFVFGSMWGLYKVVLKYVNQKRNTFIAIVLLLFPSFGMWTSGILKDTIVAASLAYYFVAFISILLKNGTNTKNLIIAIIALYFMSQVKAYVSYALLGSLVFYYLALWVLKIPIKAIRYFVLFFSLLCISGVILIFSNKIMALLNEFLIESFFSEAVKQGSRITVSGQRGDGDNSTYSLGVDYLDKSLDFKTVLKLIPSAIITTLYRPFLWEANKLIVLFAAVENFIGFLISIWFIFKSGIFRFNRILFNTPFYIYLLVFILLFAFLIGISSGNFGTLSRYRTPCIVTYYIFLYLIYYQASQEKSTI